MIFSLLTNLFYVLCHVERSETSLVFSLLLYSELIQEILRCTQNDKEGE